MPLGEIDFQSRLDAVESRIAKALARSGRKRSEITLVAVTKKFSSEIIRSAYEAGMREFGENYVQEFAEKRPALADLSDARFHLIGHLQSNKAKVAADLFQVIQTADSTKLLERLNSSAQQKATRLEVLLEVKLSDEESKTGASANALPELINFAQRCEHLKLSGLMTMPPWSDNPEDSRPYFKKLFALGEQYSMQQLSMGMSGDFEVALAEGATIIRVGTALFGPRPKP